MRTQELRAKGKELGEKQESGARSWGSGLGGFTVHLLKQRIRLSLDTAALVTLLYAGAIPLCLWLLARFPFEMERLPLYFLAPLLPFFLAGMALSIVFDL